MRIRNIQNAQEMIDQNPYVISNPQEFRGQYQKIFNNNNPIHLENWHGQGRFFN